MEITSPQNQLIKKILRLRDNQKRKKDRLFIVEGIKEATYALHNNFSLIYFLVCEELLDKESKVFITFVGTLSPKPNVISINKICFEKLAIRADSFGFLAVFEDKIFSLEDISKRKKPLLLTILESIEKPGNLGAISRTLAACSGDGIICLDPSVDPYNPNVVRSSLGTIFLQPFVKTSREELLEFCEKNSITLFSSYIHKDSKNYWDADFKSSCGFVMGREHEGIQDLLPTSKPILIPMGSMVDSLNVSVAFALLSYEALRQRFSNNNFK